MELFDKLKIYVPIAITVISSITSGVFVAKQYFDTHFVLREEYEQFKMNGMMGVLENRKALLENRLYFLDICKTTPSCSFRNNVFTDIDKTRRELDDIRGHLETLRSKRID